jgi:hypothetical protein
MVVTSHLPEAAFFLGPHPAAIEKWAQVHDPAAAGDPLGAIDALLVTYREQKASRESLQRAQDAERERLLRKGRDALEAIVKPALWAVAHRLQRDVGDGFVASGQPSAGAPQAACPTARDPSLRDRPVPR